MGPAGSLNVPVLIAGREKNGKKWEKFDVETRGILRSISYGLAKQR
jgi:hypothetical protein